MTCHLISSQDASPSASTLLTNISCPFLGCEKTPCGALLTRSAFNTILFICFLLLFTSLALSEPRNKMRAFEGFLRKRFDEASPVRLEEVQSVDSFWRYFNEPWNTMRFLQLHDSGSFSSLTDALILFLPRVLVSQTVSFL